MGVSTGEAIWQAKQKCRELVVVPPQHELYEEFSRKTYEIYTRYTDQIEAFGIDECWLDVTGSQRLFGNGEEIAFKIKETVKAELGLRISVGVSFNKIFAKLGSDMKKPDAITVIPFESFHEKIWGLPCSDLLGVGRATNVKLKRYQINTIGELAKTSPEFLSKLLGVCGTQLWRFANGLDSSPVTHQDYNREIKSVGNSTTCCADLVNDCQVWAVLLRLSQTVSERLRKHNLSANGVQISIKTPDLLCHEFQCGLPSSVRTSLQLSRAAFGLFNENFHWDKDIRALGVRAINLTFTDAGGQLCIFDDYKRIEKLERLEDVSDSLKKKYGRDVIFPLSLKKDIFSNISQINFRAKA
jgi:DNA polymerase-4